MVELCGTTVSKNTENCEHLFLFLSSLDPTPTSNHKSPSPPLGNVQFKINRKLCIKCCCLQHQQHLKLIRLFSRRIPAMEQWAHDRLTFLNWEKHSPSEFYRFLTYSKPIVYVVLSQGLPRMNDYFMYYELVAVEILEVRSFSLLQINLQTEINSKSARNN